MTMTMRMKRWRSGDRSRLVKPNGWLEARATPASRYRYKLSP
jgi:hypothetical protein